MLDFSFPFVHFSFSTALLSFLFLSFRSCWFCLTAAVSVYVSTFASTFSPLSPTWFLMYSFLVLVLDYLIVFFRSTLLRSRSCSTGDSLWFLLGTDAWLSITFVISVLAPHYLTFCFFRSLLPDSSSQRISQCSCPAFAFHVFPILSWLISHSFFLGFDTWLSVCFLLLFPVSLPQLFHRWFPWLLIRDKCMTLISFRPSFVLALATQLSVSSVPFLLVLPHSGFPNVRLCFRYSLSPFFSTWSLMSIFQVLVLGFLFVSFCSFLLRSHSRSTGDSLDCSLGTSTWLWFPFVHLSF